MTLNDTQIEIIRFIQGDLPVTERPYLELAKQLGITEADIIEQIRLLKEAGVIRRFGMAVRHQNMGYTANGMSCWDVPPEMVDKTAEVMTALDEISHCYERPRFADWPFNMYAMIHARSRDTVHAIAKEISEKIGVTNYQVLFSTVEYKRTSMSYFMEED